MTKLFLIYKLRTLFELYFKLANHRIFVEILIKILSIIHKCNEK